MDVCAYNLDNLAAEPIHVIVNRRDTFLELKTNLAIAGEFIIGDGKHDIEIQIDGLRKSEEDPISYNILAHRKFYYKLCEEKHKYIHVHIRKFKLPVAVKVHSEDLVSILCKKMHLDPTKVQFIYSACTIPHDIMFKDTNFFLDKYHTIPHIFANIEE